MNNQQGFVIIVLVLVAVIVYLFASAPAELPEQSPVSASGEVVPVETVFRLIAAEFDVARALYADEIVAPGQQVGLAFGENWRDEGTEEGPLPELFVRETAASLANDPIGLGVFLGSDFPITASNRFSGAQMAQFEIVKSTLEPQFFLDNDTHLYTAMFPDYAMDQACIECHNSHPDSPKTNWASGDVMGATTWTYPKEAVTVDEALVMLAAVRAGFGDAYQVYLDQAQSFSDPPEIGSQWPRDGYFLPSSDVFLAEFASRVSPLTVEALIAIAAVGENP